MHSMRHVSNIADLTQRVAAMQLLNARSDIARGLSRDTNPTFDEAQATLRAAETNCRTVGIDPLCVDKDGNLGPPRSMSDMRAELEALRGKSAPPRDPYDDGVQRSIPEFSAGEFARLAPLVKKAHRSTDALTLELLFAKAYRAGLEDGVRGQRHSGFMDRASCLPLTATRNRFVEQ